MQFHLSRKNYRKFHSNGKRSLCLGFHIDAITLRLNLCVNKFYGLVMFRNTRRISVSFLTKIVSAARRNRRLSTKPVAGIVMLSTLEKPKEDCMTGRLTTS